MSPQWSVSFDMHVGVDCREVIALVAECTAMAAVIRAIPLTPGRQQRIDRLNILRAVRGTTGIEGVDLTEEEVGQILATERRARSLSPTREREEKEVQNANTLMHYVARLLSANPGYPLSETVICKFHEILTKGIDYLHNTPGRYRTFSVNAGDYVPPREAEDVRRLMKEFVEWFNQGPPAGWPPIVQALVAHFYLVSIHPFGDGNGRTSRAVESFLLYKAGVNARGFYSLANYYYQDRAGYVRHLDAVRFETNGDLTPFVLFALRGLKSELAHVHQMVLEAVSFYAFRDLAREWLHDKLGSKSGQRMLELVMGLAESVVPVSDIRDGGHPLSRPYRNMTPKTLTRDLNYLKGLGLIAIEDGKVRNRLELMGSYLPESQLARAL